MSVTFTSTEIEKLAHAVHLLVAPLDHETVDAWRSAVNRQVGNLLSADSSGFLLPVSDGLALYSEEHDPKALAAFPELQPPLLPDGRTVWEEGIRAGVTTIHRAYGSAYYLFSQSPYYNEFAAANHAHDTISATVALSGVAMHQCASLHFWHSQPTGRLFGERELTILRLLFPAFRAGVEMQVRWHSARGNLFDSLDTLGHPVEVFDILGRSLHQTPALASMLARDPEHALIAGEVQGVMNAVRTVALGASCGSSPVFSGAREARTQAARYTIRGCVHGGPPRGSEMRVLVSVEKLTRSRCSDSELRDNFGLTRAEVRVAILLSDGKSNAEIATELGVSTHTARRHTEHVMQKMGIRSRAQVATLLFP